MKKCAIYARVSTAGQDPEKQIDILKEYAARHDYNLYKTYIDVASGAKADRSGLMDLIQDAHNKEFDILLVYKLDRLGRSLPHLVKVTNYFKKWEIDFVSITEQIDTSSSMGTLIFHILGALSQFERDLISERTKLGLRNAKNVGKRGKDKKPRKKGGYYQFNKRQKNDTPKFHEIL